MLDSLIQKIAKNYVLKAINNVISKNKDNTSKICEKVNYWTVRLNLVIELLKKLASRCSDGELSDDEAKETLTEIEDIIKQF
jgi:uncharacterized membrane protein YgaE (UPF0421/DUF939 family)